MSVTRGSGRQTYGYLPSRNIGWYQIILLGDSSHMCVKPVFYWAAKPYTTVNIELSTEFRRERRHISAWPKFEVLQVH